MTAYIIEISDSFPIDAIKTSCEILGWQFIGKIIPSKPISRKAKQIESPLVVTKIDGSTREIDGVTVGQLMAKVPFNKGTVSFSGKEWKYPNADRMVTNNNKITKNDDGEWSCKRITDEYVREFIKLNHLVS